jgi:lipoyl(octanoyl) transferase
VRVHWLGTNIAYNDALNIQRQYVNELLAARADAQPSDHHLLLLEHSPVYTVGLRAHVYTAEDERRLRALGADFVRSDRGGLITFHGPGQLVAYPIFDLCRLRTIAGSVRAYVCAVERAIIDMLSVHFGLVKACTTKNTGVWLPADENSECVRELRTHALAVQTPSNVKWRQSDCAYVNMSPRTDWQSTVHTSCCVGMST